MLCLLLCILCLLCVLCIVRLLCMAAREDVEGELMVGADACCACWPGWCPLCVPAPSLCKAGHRKLREQRAGPAVGSLPSCPPCIVSCFMLY